MTSTKMVAHLKTSLFFVFFLLSAAMGQLDTTEGYISKLYEMALKNSETLSKLEKRQEAFPTNLSREFDESVRKLYLNLSKTFDEKLLQIELKVTEKLGTLNDTLQKNHQQLSGALSNLTASLNLNPMNRESTNLSAVEDKTVLHIKPRIHTEIEEVVEDSGTIEFTGRANLNLTHKIWVFRSDLTYSYPQMTFVLEENGLGYDARLSLWASWYSDGGQHVWNGSQTDWRKEKTRQGNLILVTLIISPSAAKQPSFKLKFNSTTIYEDLYLKDVVYSSEFLRGEGSQVVSYPPNNSQNASSNSLFTALIAAPYGKRVQLTLNYLDFSGIPPDSCHNQFFVWFLNESPTGLPYELLPPSAFNRCGRFGDISEPIGNSTLAIIHSRTYEFFAGKGIRIISKPI